MITRVRPDARSGFDAHLGRHLAPRQADPGTRTYDELRVVALTRWEAWQSERELEDRLAAHRLLAYGARIEVNVC